MNNVWRYSLPTDHGHNIYMIYGMCDARLVLNAVKKLPKDVIAGFYTIEARNPKTGEKIGLDIGERISYYMAIRILQRAIYVVCCCFIILQHTFVA